MNFKLFFQHEVIGIAIPINAIPIRQFSFVLIIRSIRIFSTDFPGKLFSVVCLFVFLLRASRSIFLSEIDVIVVPLSHHFVGEIRLADIIN